MTEFVPSDSKTLALFVLIVLEVMVVSTFGFLKASRRLKVASARRQTFFFAVGWVLWLGLASAIVASGALQASPMPRIMFLFAGINLVAVVFAFSPVGRRLADGLPLAALVGFQSFRLPLEGVLHVWAKQGIIPETMTWTGSNLDVVTGVLALLTMRWADRHSWVAWTFNIVGFLLLLNVGRVALLSSPLPFAWDVEPTLQLIFYLPYAWIGPVCVAGALAGHMVLFRALMGKAR